MRGTEKHGTGGGLVHQLSHPTKVVGRENACTALALPRDDLRRPYLRETLGIQRLPADEISNETDARVGACDTGGAVGAGMVVGRGGGWCGAVLTLAPRAKGRPW